MNTIKDADYLKMIAQILEWEDTGMIDLATSTKLAIILRDAHNCAVDAAGKEA